MIIAVSAPYISLIESIFRRKSDNDRVASSSASKNSLAFTGSNAKSDGVTGIGGAVVDVGEEGATVVVRADGPYVVDGPTVVGADGPPDDIDAVVVEAAGKRTVVESRVDVVAVEGIDVTATDVVVVIGMAIGGM